LKKYQDEDPLAAPKLVIPISTITAIVENYQWTPHLSAAADLVIIAFFYLLRVREYTTPATPRDKCTIPLHDCNVRLWQNGHLLSHSAGLTTLLTADSATVSIAHTKNGAKGTVVHHKAFGRPICPGAALAQRIANIQMGPPSGIINLVYMASGQTSCVSDHDIGIVVQWGAASDSLISWGYTLDRISSHSLRASGAMAMKLSGALDSTIMRVGRWSSLTYLTYIHSQIGALPAGVAWKMSKAFTFQNVG
jgi:hypothetical protein